MIITDEKQLRIECKDVLSEEIPLIRDALEAELKLSYERGRPGIGLAAPQIAIHKKMAIVRITNESGITYNVDLVNAKIAQGFDKRKFIGEGCLSFPDLSVTTFRFNEIRVVENAVFPHEFIATGLFAVCIQHELDHLNGVLLPDLSIT